MKLLFDIKGMHCQSCVQRLTQAFSKVQGVTAARVALSPPHVEIEASGPIDVGTLQTAARSVGNYIVHERATAPSSAVSAPAPAAGPIADAAAPRPSLYPLILIVSFITGVTLLTTYHRGAWSWHVFGNDFMAGFFLVFSFFKLLDLRGFADAYQSYDIIARHSRPWALAYPFVELGLGIAYLIRFEPVVTNVLTLALMVVGSIGVIKAVIRKSRIRCACLGTALNLPMTTVTIVEDLGMAAMALLMLVGELSTAG